MDNLEEQLQYFGYTDGKRDNPYAFFDYGEDSKCSDAFEGFKQLNKEV